MSFASTSAETQCHILSQLLEMMQTNTEVFDHEDKQVVRQSVDKVLLSYTEEEQRRKKYNDLKNHYVDLHIKCEMRSRKLIEYTQDLPLCESKELRALAEHLMEKQKVMMHQRTILFREFLKMGGVQKELDYAIEEKMNQRLEKYFEDENHEDNQNHEDNENHGNHQDDKYINEHDHHQQEPTKKKKRKKKRTSVQSSTMPEHEDDAVDHLDHSVAVGDEYDPYHHRRHRHHHPQSLNLNPIPNRDPNPNFRSQDVDADMVEDCLKEDVDKQDPKKAMLNPEAATVVESVVDTVVDADSDDAVNGRYQKRRRRHQQQTRHHRRKKRISLVDEQVENQQFEEQDQEQVQQQTQQQQVGPDLVVGTRSFSRRHYKRSKSDWSKSDRSKTTDHSHNTSGNVDVADDENKTFDVQDAEDVN